MDGMNGIVAERLSWAMQPGSLALLEGTKLGKAEYLICLGWVGIRHKTASVMYRMVCGMDMRRYDETLKEVEALVSHMAARRKWPVKPHHYPAVAKDALNFLVAPKCPQCNGRKYEVIEGTARLSARVCAKCGGSGHRRVDSRYLADVIYELAMFEDIITHEVAKKLRGPK